LSSPEGQVPPVGYGGGERTTDVLVRELVELGHEVDLFAGEGSTCPATNLHIVPGKRMQSEVKMFATLKLEDRGRQYDIVIDHTAHHLAGQHFNGHVISIMGGDPFKKYPHDSVRNKVYKSKEFAWFCNKPNSPVLPSVMGESPVDVRFYNDPGPEDYLLYVGMVRKFKGVHIAVEAARILGVKLKVAGPTTEAEYWEEITSDPVVEYLGILEQEDRDEIFGRAMAFLYPVEVCDCNPNAPKESMLRGTPVVCSPKGGLLSFVKAGVNGAFASTAKQFADAVNWVKYFDRAIVRASIIQQTNSRYAARVLESLCDRASLGERW